jgi:hypothetical protein
MALPIRPAILIIRDAAACPSRGESMQKIKLIMTHSNAGMFIVHSIPK